MTISAFTLPFEEAIEFFRQKVPLPTQTSKDLDRDMHARAFVVAGAAKADLLTDLYNAVDKATATGTTLAQFRKDFDATVEKNGWSYKGSRGVRTRIIYENNLRQAYNAGRYAQMMDPDVLKNRPFWEYHHQDGQQHPRPLHASWNGLVLAANDPWWHTHSPMNGHGCKCRVFTRSGDDLKKLGKSGPDTAPNDGTYRYTDPATGQTRDIPNGIDPGWDYDPGAAAGYKTLLGKFDSMDYPVARKFMDEYAAGPAFGYFLDGGGPDEFPVAVLSQALLQAIGAKSHTVWLSGETLQKNLRKHPDIEIGDYRLLPSIVDDADLVVQDGPRTEVFIKKGGKLYHASVKATRDGRELYLTTLHTTRQSKLDGIKKKGKILRDAGI